jgi:hypothetical protein
LGKLQSSGSFRKSDDKLAMVSRFEPQTAGKGAHDMAKLGTWLIVVGILFALFGLTVLPSALSSGEDKTLLNISVLVLSFAMTVVAGGLYLKARALPSATVTDSGNAKRGRKANCDSCGKQEPVIQCRVHQLHLCADCLTRHYDVRSCAYVPSTRRGSKPSAYSQASGA